MWCGGTKEWLCGWEGAWTSELFQLIISCCCSFAVVILDSNYYQMVLKPNTHTHTHAYKEKPVRFFQ